MGKKHQVAGRNVAPVVSHDDNKINKLSQGAHSSTQAHLVIRLCWTV